MNYLDINPVSFGRHVAERVALSGDGVEKAWGWVWDMLGLTFEVGDGESFAKWHKAAEVAADEEIDILKLGK